jgi:septal ring-binding cell division protein DamX
MLRRNGVGLWFLAVAVLAVAAAWLQPVSAQSPPPLPAATPTSLTETPAAVVSPEASPSATPLDTPSPSPTPTQPPIIAEPPTAALPPGSSQVLRLLQVAGQVTVSVADPSIAEATVDQTARTLTIVARAIGRTVATVADERGQTRDVPIRVAYLAGTVPRTVGVRITGNPATSLFVKEEAVRAAIRGVVPRPGATIVATIESVNYSKPLRVDNITTVDVPVIVQGDEYLTVQGTTRVRVENFAVPFMRPGLLMVSDYPETLHENGVLFTADLSPSDANSSGVKRFLYYHYNPPAQPDRRIVLKVENASREPALLQFISGRAGSINEMEAGHLSTQRFLVRSIQNEGSVRTIPGNSVFTLVDQLLPAGFTVSNLLQLHEIYGPPLHLTLLAQNATDPVQGPVPPSILLRSDVFHARGIYKPPEFFWNRSYDADGENLEVPIGQIPIPNLMQGQALAGDYGVLQAVTIDMTNQSSSPRDVALYANPRGGRATGTFLIDGVLVQAHALPAFSHYKLRQYTIPPHSFIRTEIVTMPEGGSSYPLRLIVGPDDGGPPPGAPDSLIY